MDADARDLGFGSDDEEEDLLLPPPVDEDGAHRQADCARVVVHLDVDAFYCQVEELRDPSLASVPMAVSQKYICVTANYPARARGVGKLMTIADALQTCPELVLVNGEDLTPYRAVSRRLLAVAARFGPTEKLGMDEVFVDCTAAARLRCRSGEPVFWCGWVHDPGVTSVQAPNKHRKMDLCAVAGGDGHGHGAAPQTPADMLLAAGSAVAADIREALASELHLRCSAGIAHNKLLAKMASGLHKPAQQTCLPSDVAHDFIGPLPCRAIRGCGHTTERALAAVGVTTVADLRRLTQSELLRALASCPGGNRIAGMLWHAARGRDAAPVVPVGPPKTISVEDSCRGITTFAAAHSMLSVLAPDLATRLAEEHAERGRMASTLALSWRLAQAGRQTASMAMPSGTGKAHHAAALLDAALSLLRAKVREPFVVTLLNLSGGKFSEGHRQAAPAATAAAAPSGVDGHLAAQQRRTYAQLPSVAVSKRQERLLREAAGGAAAPIGLPAAFADGAPSPGGAAASGLLRFFRSPVEEQHAAADGAIRCEQCGKEVPPGATAEHADWHFAQRLQREETTSAQEASKKRKAVGSLDAFLRA
jgi:DNA polymerase iota